MTDLMLNAKLLNVRDLFFLEQGTSYMIPTYQRNYTWRVEQIEQLIGDIRDAKDDGQSSYFLGNLIVTRRATDRTGRIDYEVIDGQQRLTTLYLILTVLRDVVQEVLHSNEEVDANGYQDRLCYQSRPHSTEALRRLRASLSKDVGTAPNTSLKEDQGIHEGFNVVRQFIGQNAGVFDSAFADYLLNKVSVVRAVLPAKTDLNRYFEVMNTRGQQLQQVDIVKARLMSVLDSSNAHDTFAWVWDACADMDSYVQMALTRLDTESRNDLFGTDWEWLTAPTFDKLVETHLKRVGDRAVENSASSDSMNIDRALLKYAETEAPAITDDAENVRFRSTIEFPVFLLHVLKVWSRVDDDDEGRLDDKKLIEQFARAFDRSSKSLDELRKDVKEFAVLMLRCRNIFDAYIIKRQFTAATIEDGDWSLQRLIKGKSSPNNKKTHSPRYIAVAQRHPTEREDDAGADGVTRDLLLIQSMFRVTYTSPRTMHWITKVLRTVHDAEPKGLESTQNVLAVLREYARAKVRAELTNGEPKTGFEIARIVFTYVDLLLVLKNQDHFPEFRFSYRNSIEHFYPQCPDTEQSGDTVGNDCRNMFGNLALITSTANSKFSNSLPKAKAENFRDTIELQSPKLACMADITRTSTWNDDKVREHHGAMVRLLREDLGIRDEA
jgi:hypothetical protein